MIKINQGEIFRHFKGKYYIIENIAVDANTNEFIIVYRALYGNKDIWCRTLADFQDFISVYREDNITGQIRRFQKVEEYMR
jgi:hypothetical protein